MKAIMTILVAAVLFTSCSNGTSTSTASNVDTTKKEMVDTTKHAVDTTMHAVDTMKH